MTLSKTIKLFCVCCSWSMLLAASFSTCNFTLSHSSDTVCTINLKDLNKHLRFWNLSKSQYYNFDELAKKIPRVLSCEALVTASSPPIVISILLFVKAHYLWMQLHTVSSIYENLYTLSTLHGYLHAQQRALSVFRLNVIGSWTV